ncbi:MAG: hypothetical protein CMF37_15090 [Leeuwenhoekiella sp.]|jgi:hypothetical protein|nr:hypothetical protein [Leeuwenhoekiella sp.]MBQ50257.1 hypothetical protein [Leeuwenhoekiella sp.]MBQ50454.1 hypothetical protein [Leeuwenhoekiella sp.]|tara:strand:+ start:4806 stop:5177 length:372 start_codon:yes stop_codon:yes gene_type:complete
MSNKKSSETETMLTGASKLTVKDHPAINKRLMRCLSFFINVDKDSWMVDDVQTSNSDERIVLMEEFKAKHLSEVECLSKKLLKTLNSEDARELSKYVIAKAFNLDYYLNTRLMSIAKKLWPVT